MEAKNKAIELVEKYKKHVNGYVGSSMLSNTEYPETILNNAKQCALICVDEILSASPSLPILSDNGTYGSDIEESTKWWKKVKQEILNLKQ